MSCDWCPDEGSWRAHLWLLCTRHYILHRTVHGC